MPTENGTAEDASNAVLPEGWTRTKLKEVARIEAGNSPKGTTTNTDGEGIPLIGGASDIANGVPEPHKHTTAPTKICEPGDLVFCIRATIGKHCVADEAYCLGRGVAGIRPERVDADWLGYFLSQSEQALKERGTGTTFKQISKTILEEFPVTLPPPEEQRRIAERIGAVQSHATKAREALERLPTLLDEYRQGMLHAAFSGRLTADWRAEHAEGAEPAAALLERIEEERQAQWEKDYRAKYEKKGKEPPSGWKSRYSGPVDFEPIQDLAPLPDGWTWTNVEHLAIYGPQNGLYLPKRKYGSGTPILRIDDYQIGWSRSPDELRRVEADASDVEKYSLAEGDLVVNRVNSVSHLGKSLLVEEENLPSLFESNMMRLGLTSHGDRKFVEYYLQSATGRQALIQNAKHAVNQASINQGDVKSTPVPLPPAAEQREIVRRVEQRLERIDQLARHVEAATERMDGLDRAVLAKAFRGELVETEAVRAEREGRGYESAEALLEDGAAGAQGELALR